MATQRSESRSTGQTLPAGIAQADSGTDGAQAKRPARRRATLPDDANVAAASKGQAQQTQGTEVSNEARYMMIQEAAYLRAERRGFEPGFELEDWLAAENEVDTLLGASHGAVAAQ
jgi:hypothetical protein